MNQSAPKNNIAEPRTGSVTVEWLFWLQALADSVQTTSGTGAAAPAAHHASHEPNGADALQLSSPARLFGRGGSQGAGPVEEITLGPSLQMIGTQLVATTSPTGGGGPVAPHAATHAAGASDPVVVTGLAGFPGGTTTFLRADGAFAAGLSGPTGPTGPAGPTGATGGAGSPGPTGATGTTGATGATGPAGPAGATGPTGSAGPAGTTGATGPAGTTGAAGPTGPTGATGATGPAPAGTGYVHVTAGLLDTPASRLGVEPGALGTPAIYPTNRPDYGLIFDSGSGRKVIIGSVFEELTVDCNAHVVAVNQLGLADLGLSPATMGGARSLLITTAAGIPGVQFGGTTSAFPGIQRNGTKLAVRLADDSGDAPLTAATAAATTSTTQVATTAFVQGEIAAKAPLASPTFTGTPAAPTATAGDTTTKLATTAFVQTALAPAVATWTPVDVSGDGITFTSTTGRYVVLGSLVFFTCSITWPSIPSGGASGVRVGGLPFTSVVQSAVSIAYSEFATTDRGLTQVNQQYFLILSTTNVAVTNINMSLKTMIVSGFYFR